MNRPIVSKPLARLAAGAALLLFAVPSFAVAADDGVTPTEIVIGTTTDLSGVTAVQGVNNSNAIRLVFDDVNKAGGINGRKIHYIVEDTQYTVPRAVQAINKLINLDHVFFEIADGGTPMNNAEMPMEFAKGVPNVFPLTGARSMYQPYNRLKFGQFSSYYDQMRAAVKYFVNERHIKRICSLYQDSDFGKDVFAGVQDEAKALNMPIVATVTDHPTDTDFTATLAKLRDANCDFVGVGTIVRDSVDVLSQAKKMGWHPAFVGQAASYDTAVATAPGGVGDGFYSMAPALYAYPDDKRPEVQKFATEYKERYGIDPNFLGETGFTAANMVVLALKNAGPNLTRDSFIKAMEAIHDYHDIFGTTLSLGPNQHHAETASFLSVIKNGRWVPVTTEQLSY